MGTSRRPGQVNQWCALFENECRRRRLRVTVQRLAVYRALAVAVTHPTADAIHARLRAEMTGLSLATVYRILESLEREGFVRRVSGQDGVGRFDANHHQHLVCRNCSCITDLEEESFARMKLPRRGLANFTPEALDIRVIGLCAPCSLRTGIPAKSKLIPNQSVTPCVRHCYPRRRIWLKQ